MGFSNKLRGKFSKETLSSISQSLKGAYPSLSRGAMFRCACVALIASIAFLVRILPLQWGAYLSEFDPYYHYRITEYVAQNWQSWFTESFWEWHDYKSWWPGGRDIWGTTPPGLPFSGAIVYLLLKLFGLQVSVMDVCIFFPPVVGAITCIALYFLGKDIGGAEVGLLGALILSLNAAYIGRTYLGFYKHETVGILALVLIALFFLRSIEPQKPLSSCILYSLAAGFSLGYIEISWSAFYYAVDLLALFVVVMILLRRYNLRLLLSYTITMGLSLLIAIHVPRPGFHVLTSIGVLPALVAIFLLFVYEFLSHIKTLKMKIVAASCMFLSIAVIVLFIMQVGIVSPLIHKLVTAINPFARLEMPIVESVAEHRAATWAAFYYEFGFFIFLLPIGFFFALRRPTDKNIYLILFAITSLYFAASMVRLTLILASAFAILVALAVVELIKPFMDIARGSAFFPRRKMRFISGVGSEFGIITVIIVLLLIAPLHSFSPMNRGVDSANTPVTIASATIPSRQNFGDWLEACAWIHDNTPQNAVICSWWDYGYYLTVIGNRTTLADNSTWNTTQIKNIGRIYMSNETQAIPMLKRYGVNYVVVFTTLNFFLGESPARRAPLFYGEEVKWEWMARIAELSEASLRAENLSKQIGVADYGLYIPRNDTVLTKLMLYPFREQVASSGAAVPLPTNFKLVYASTRNMVLIYEVKY